jgi:soluble lytic murein transglycosylase-like protein
MRFIFYFLLLIPACAFADQSSDFLAAHDAFIAGDTVKLGRYAQRLKKSPLEVYISYYQLSLNMKNTDTKHVEESVKSFLARPEDTPMIDLLRGEWLKLLGMRQQWELFDAEYPRLLNEDTELACYALQSRRRNHELDALREARKLWFTGKGQPDSCGKLFEAAMAANIISEQDVSQRMRLALEANNVSLATKLSDQLDGKYADLSAMLKSAAADPDRYLKKLTPDNTSSTERSDVTISPTSGVAAAQVLKIELLPGLENPPLTPTEAIPTPSSEWVGWGNFLSRLGFGKADKESPPAPATANAELALSHPLDVQVAGCKAPCEANVETTVSPLLRLSPKLANAGQRIVALFALQRLAKQSSDLAAERWTKLAGYFPVTDQHYFYGRLAYEAARNQDERALRWYKAAADTPLEDYQLAWRVRAALRVQDWHEVLAGVNAMDEQQRRDPAWQYWKARALLVLGKPIEAREILAPLSGEIHFYGQLAGAELADAPVLSAAVPIYKPDQQAISDMSALPGIQRTLALYRMNLRNEARDEWRWVLRNFNDRELLTAAEIARRNEMYDRAIGAAERTVNMHDFSLRYLAPYRSQLQADIRKQSLEEAWVYGLMRQESRFTTGAKSDTGAAGIMQVMPSTARWVANKLGLKGYRNALIQQLDTNLLIGTYYLKTVLSRSENNPVLASAAYNAGPLRALQWRSARPLEGAIYAESIPFEETRDYVKKVMSNTAYYADQFGDPPRSLKQRMGIIPPKTVDTLQVSPYAP